MRVVGRRRRRRRGRGDERLFAVAVAGGRWWLIWRVHRGERGLAQSRDGDREGERRGEGELRGADRVDSSVAILAVQLAIPRALDWFRPTRAPPCNQDQGPTRPVDPSTPSAHADQRPASVDARISDARAPQQPVPLTATAQLSRPCLESTSTPRGSVASSRRQLIDDDDERQRVAHPPEPAGA